MTLTEKTTHADESVARLISQFKAKPKIEGVVAAQGDQTQDEETVFFDLLENRSIDTGVGAQLDGIGEIVGEERAGKEDAEYKVYLNARILVNISSGTPDQLNELANLLIGDDNALSFRELYPASFNMVVADTFPTDAAAVAALLASARLGGVRGFLEYTDADDADTFTFADADVEQSDTARGFAAASSLIVIVGQSGEIQTSTDGITWTARAAAGGYVGFFHDVAHNGVDLWCAVGQSGEIQTSPDGITWTARTAAGGYSDTFRDVAYNGVDLWCAVGSTGEIQTSPDGTTWTARTAAGGYTGTILGIAHDQSGLWCMVGDTGEIQTSPDGTTWTARTAAGGFASFFRDVSHDRSGLWCAVGNGGEIQTSPDGTTWTARTAAGGFSDILYGAFYNEGLWCAVGQSGEIQTSPDGTTWTAQTAAGSYTGAFRTVVHNGAVWCTVGDSGEIQTSPAGAVWTARTAAGGFSGFLYGNASSGYIGGVWAAVEEA